MSQHIELQLLEIMQLIARIALQGQYQIHARLSGHVDLIQIRIHPVGETWKAEAFPKPIATADAYYSLSDWQHLTPSQRILRVTSELDWLHAALHAYLAAEHLDAKEAV